jgi:hypothetical protein
MNELTIAKIQNTINEIENQLTKIYVDTPVFRVLMNRTVIQLNELMIHIGFLEGKLRINSYMKFDEWLELGIKNSWCGPAVCETHDGLPITFEEEDQFFEGNDPCIHILRLYEDKEIASQVEDNHAPSNWRKPHELNDD